MPRDALVRQPLIRFISQDDRDSYYLYRKQLFKTDGEPQVCELRMLRQDGVPFWAYLEATVAEEAAGMPVGRVALREIAVSAQWDRRAEYGGAEYRGGMYTLTVADNGVGLPADLDLATTTTLGLWLVRLLAKHQLGGSIEIDREGGTRFVLQFGSTQRR